jgi:hypothetical protein
VDGGECSRRLFDAELDTLETVIGGDQVVRISRDIGLQVLEAADVRVKL